MFEGLKEENCFCHPEQHPGTALSLTSIEAAGGSLQSSACVKRFLNRGKYLMLVQRVCHFSV